MIWTGGKEEKSVSVTIVSARQKLPEKVYLSRDKLSRLSMEGSGNAGLDRWMNRLMWSWQAELGKWFCSKQHIICGNQRESAASTEDWIKRPALQGHSDQRVELVFQVFYSVCLTLITTVSLSLSGLITYSVIILPSKKTTTCS